MLQLPEVQEFVAEARERHALMTTRRARRYQRGSICKSQNGEIWYGKYYPAPGAPQKRVQLGRSSEMNEKQARTALDDMMAVLNRNPAHAMTAFTGLSCRRCMKNRATKLALMVAMVSAMTTFKEPNWM